MLPEEEMFGDEQEVLKGQIQEFLNEFESSEETEEDMKIILKVWRDEILDHAKHVGGHVFKATKRFMVVCDDYANNRGMLERVKKEAEEVRLHLDL